MHMLTRACACARLRLCVLIHVCMHVCERMFGRAGVCMNACKECKVWACGHVRMHVRQLRACMQVRQLLGAHFWVGPLPIHCVAMCPKGLEPCPKGPKGFEPYPKSPKGLKPRPESLRGHVLSSTQGPSVCEIPGQPPLQRRAWAQPCVAMQQATAVKPVAMPCPAGCPHHAAGSECQKPPETWLLLSVFGSLTNRPAAARRAWHSFAAAFACAGA